MRCRCCGGWRRNYRRNSSEKIPIEEASERLKTVKNFLGLSIPKFAEAIDVTTSRLLMFLYESSGKRAGYKNAPLSLVEAAEKLVITMAPVRHRHAKPTKQEVQAALRETNYRKVEAAKILGVSSGTINKLINTYRIKLPAKRGADAGYGFVRLSDLTPKQRLRWASERRAIKLGKMLYETGKVYIGPVPGKEIKIKARHYYIAVAPRSIVTFDPRINALRSPNIPPRDYELSNLSIYDVLQDWRISVDDFNEFLESEEFKFRIRSKQPLEAGVIYATTHDLYLALDSTRLLILIDGEAFVKDAIYTSDLEPLPNFEVKDLVKKWGISFQQLDRLVEEYYPRPVKRKLRQSEPLSRIIKRWKGYQTNRKLRRRNPDKKLRQLYRDYLADSTHENFVKWQRARIRAGKQFYYHDCQSCIFLGSESEPYDRIVLQGYPDEVDYYYCPSNSPSRGSLLIRYDSEGSKYMSCPVDIALHMEDSSEATISTYISRALQLVRQAGYI